MISAFLLALTTASQVNFVNVTIKATITNPRTTYCAGDNIAYVVSINNPAGIPYFNSTGNGPTRYSVEFRGAPSGPDVNAGACGARGCLFQALGQNLLKDVVNAGSGCCGGTDASIQGHFQTLPSMIDIQGFIHPEVWYPEYDGGSTNFMTSAVSVSFLIVDCSGNSSVTTHGSVTSSQQTDVLVNSTATVTSISKQIIWLILVQLLITL